MARRWRARPLYVVVTLLLIALCLLVTLPVVTGGSDVSSPSAPQTPPPPREQDDVPTIKFRNLDSVYDEEEEVPQEETGEASVAEPPAPASDDDATTPTTTDPVEETEHEVFPEEPSSATAPEEEAATSTPATTTSAEEEESSDSSTVERPRAIPSRLSRSRVKLENNHSSKAKSLVQGLFITKTMRQQLTRELGFLPSEVDDMLPSVAAILCKKKMVRPSKGMPMEWRRSFHSGRGPLRKAQAILAELWSVARHHHATAATVVVTGTVATAGLLFLIKKSLEPSTALPWRYTPREEDDEDYDEDEEEDLPAWAHTLKPNLEKVRRRQLESWLGRWNKKSRYYGAKN